MARSSTKATRKDRKARSMGGARAIAPRVATASPAAAERPAVIKPTADAVPEPRALVVTHWFDAGEGDEPYTATIRFTGQRIGVRGRPKPTDAFVRDETVEVVPGSGPISVTATIQDIEQGEWSVTGQLVRADDETESRRPAGRSRFAGAEPTHQAAWSWRSWRIANAPEAPLRTRWAVLAPLTRMPAVVPGLFSALVATGGVVLIGLQAAILAGQNVPSERTLLVSVVAMIAGIAGAKLWYGHLHPGPWRQQIVGGWAVDGFLFVALPVAIVACILFDVPIGAYLDATTPGLFFGVAIGRIGCFFTGCCAGRCTRSRWGVWSSDRRIGARRIPTQLIESLGGVVLALVTTPLVVGRTVSVSGAVFVVAFAVYMALRQVLLRLRAERREYSWRRSRLIGEGGAGG